MDNIVNKNQVLPQDINDILNSDYQRVLLYNLRKKYKLSTPDVKTMETAVDLLFNLELKVDKLEEYLKSKLETKDVNTNLFARDIIGLRLYPALDYFKNHGENLETYIQTNGSVDEEYVSNVETMKQAIKEEKAGTYNHDKYLYANEKEAKPEINIANNDHEVLETIDTGLTDEDRMLRLKKFFEDGVGDALDLVDDEDNLLEEVNYELISVLTTKPTFKEELRKILSTSKLLIGKDNIILEEKPVPPTGANWLRDFFSVVGSDNFDSLSIAKYIISSANAKKLNEDIQVKLRRFLTLYHNINYFPTPFSAIPVENWEIMPGAIHGSSVAPASINKTMPASIKPEINKQTPSAPVKPIETEVKASPAPVAPQLDSIIKAAPTLSEMGDDADLIELKNMLLQYPEGSLERAAIEEEIKTLQKK